MKLCKTDDFIADVEQQFEWYLINAGVEIADRYLDAVEATCKLIGQHPLLGPPGGFDHPKLYEASHAWTPRLAPSIARTAGDLKSPFCYFNRQ